MKAMLFAAVIAGVSASAIILFLQNRSKKIIKANQVQSFEPQTNDRLRLSQHAMG